MTSPAQQIAKFIRQHDLSASNLVLDSTGPSLTRHYVALHAIGLDNLDRFKEIHTFSGGTFAYFGFRAAATNQCRHPLTEYYGNLDRCMRKAHAPRVPLLGPALHYLRKKSLYKNNDPMRQVIRYVFPDELLITPLLALPGNFSAYLGTSAGLIKVSQNEHPDSLPSVSDLLAAAINIPFLYGTSAKYNDPAFHHEYKKTLRALGKNDAPTLVITPWKNGIKGNIWYVNPFLPANQKRVMARDIACLLLNVPNRTYGQDLRSIFGEQF